MEKRWVAQEKADAQIVEKLSKELNVDEILSNMMAKRGIRSFEEAKDFFRPDLRLLHDPFLMKDMPQAIERIERAIKNQEHILVYGDYDVDGTTSVALTYSFFKQIHPFINYYIPDRYKEGYGISSQGIDYAAYNNYTLIIALDCGIKSVDKVAYATEK